MEIRILFQPLNASPVWFSTFQVSGRGNVSNKRCEQKEMSTRNAQYDSYYLIYCMRNGFMFKIKFVVVPSKLTFIFSASPHLQVYNHQHNGRLCHDSHLSETK